MATKEQRDIYGVEDHARHIWRVYKVGEPIPFGKTKYDTSSRVFYYENKRAFKCDEDGIFKYSGKAFNTYDGECVHLRAVFAYLDSNRRLPHKAGSYFVFSDHNSKGKQ